MEGWPEIMKILLCVKQVPDVERIVVRDVADGMALLDISNEFRMNRFDEFAVEEAVRIKESMAEVSIHVITVGPEQAADVLKRPMGMGADVGIHLQTPTDADPGPGIAAAWIAGYARSKGYELIICGSMSEDGMHGQVGPMAAACLNLPYATQVIAIQPVPDPSELSIEREIEGGVREMLNIRLPALLTLQPGINRPRYPSLSRLLRAHRQGVETIPTETLGPAEALVDCLGLMAPARMRPAHVLTGPAGEKAARLAAILKEKALI
jgi:electron transfer flavoprotein beta subunit